MEAQFIIDVKLKGCAVTLSVDTIHPLGHSWVHTWLLELWLIRSWCGLAILVPV